MNKNLIYNIIGILMTIGGCLVMELTETWVTGLSMACIGLGILLRPPELRS
jgi:hypothetical protein